PALAHACGPVPALGGGGPDIAHHAAVLARPIREEAVRDDLRCLRQALLDGWKLALPHKLRDVLRLTVRGELLVAQHFGERELLRLAATRHHLSGWVRDGALQFDCRGCCGCSGSR